MFVTWMCPNGMKTARGDPILKFDTQKLQERLTLARHDERRAEAKMNYDNHRLQTELEALKDEKKELEAELAVVQASLRKERNVDADRVALLKAQYEQNEDTARNLRRDVEKKQMLVNLGQLAEDELTTARIALGKSESETKVSRFEWKRESDRIDQIEVARLEVAEKEALLKLGRSGESEDGAPAKRGIEKRIEALERQIESKRNQNQAELDRARNDAREALRDSFDHTPLNFIEILEMDSSNAIRRVAFGPTGEEPLRELPDGFELDDGSLFQPDRGYGWDRDLRDRVELRDEGDPLQRGVVLVKGRATWRCRVEPGAYRLRIGVGDKGDWHGPLIGHGERVLLSKIKIDSWEVIEDSVRVDGDELVLTIGDEWGKAMRAPGEGVANCMDWLNIGDRVRWASWPVAYFSPSDRFTIEGLVHQDLAGLLDPAPAREGRLEESDAGGSRVEIVVPAAAADSRPSAPSSRALRIALARQELATNRLEALTIGGVNVPCRVEKIDNIAVEMKRGAEVWWWGDEKKGKDLIARQVFLVPQTNSTEHLQLGESVRCTARITPRDGMRPVPSHLVVEGESEAHVVVAATGRQLDVEGFRVGKWFVVTAGLDAETELAVPRQPDLQTRDELRFAGEIIAGRKTEVGLANYWGRIKDLVPDGSNVEEGELIITLINPSLEARRQEIKEAKTKAREQYLVAMETRRVKTVEAQLEHDDKVLAERRARLQLRDLEDHDPVLSTTAKAAAEQASLEAREVGRRHERYAALEAASNSLVESARIAARKAAFTATKARLDLITALRQADRLEIIEAQRKWLDAVDALSGRAGALKILRMEERVSRLKAEVELHRALEGEWREIAFERNKHIRAPVSGRIFYLTGWDDHARARTKYKKDFPVWGGDAIAQILDMSELGMEAHLPEKMYQQVNLDSKVIVGFDPAPGVEIEARIDTVGDSFVVPDDYDVNDQAGMTTTSLRVFKVRVLFSPPMELAHHLIPGTKGYVWFP
jgi:hypothetical protein